MFSKASPICFQTSWRAAVILTTGFRLLDYEVRTTILQLYQQLSSSSHRLFSRHLLSKVPPPPVRKMKHPLSIGVPDLPLPVIPQCRTRHSPLNTVCLFPLLQPAFWNSRFFISLELGGKLVGKSLTPHLRSSITLLVSNCNLLQQNGNSRQMAWWNQIPLKLQLPSSSSRDKNISHSIPLGTTAPSPTTERAALLSGLEYLHSLLVPSPSSSSRSRPRFSCISSGSLSMLLELAGGPFCPSEDKMEAIWHHLGSCQLPSVHWVFTFAHSLDTAAPPHDHPAWWNAEVETYAKQPFPAYTTPFSDSVGIISPSFCICLLTYPGGYLPR